MLRYLAGGPSPRAQSAPASGDTQPARQAPDPPPRPRSWLSSCPFLIIFTFTTFAFVIFAFATSRREFRGKPLTDFLHLIEAIDDLR